VAPLQWLLSNPPMSLFATPMSVSLFLTSVSVRRSLHKFLWAFPPTFGLSAPWNGDAQYRCWRSFNRTYGLISVCLILASYKGASCVQQYLAVGAQDRAFSIWPQGQPKPVLVMRKAFAAAISDLTWSPDSSSLCAASVDGTIMTVLFAEAELGAIMDQAQVLSPKTPMLVNVSHESTQALAAFLLIPSLMPSTVPVAASQRICLAALCRWITLDQRSIGVYQLATALHAPIAEAFS
jgi:hypothetical protein